jgi:hypothetical protein
MSISRDEWLKALSDAGLHDDTDDQSALTTIEFMQMFDLCETTARNRLAALVKAGKAIETTKVFVNARGHRLRARAFKLVETKPVRRSA